MINFEGLYVKPEHDEPQEGDILTRQSDYSTMLFSPSRLKLQQSVERLPSYEMFRGTVVHALVEDCINGAEYMQLIVGPEIEKRAVGLAHDDGFDLYQVADTDAIKRLIDDARQAFITWHASFWEPEGQYLEVLMVEDKLWRPLGVIPETGQAVWVHGTPDFVVSRNGEPEAFDWKTSKSGWSDGKFLTNPQWPIYTWLLQEAYSPDLDLNWTVLVWNAKKNEWERYELPMLNKYGDEIAMNAEYVDATMKNVWQMARCIAFDAYPAIPMSTHGPYGAIRPWYNRAAYNDAWDIDPFRYLLDGKNDEIRELGWTA